MKIKSLLVATAIALGMFTSQAKALTIDSFDDTCGDPSGVCQESISTINNTPVTSGLVTSKAIGGTRRITATKTGGGTKVTGASDTGTYSHSQNAGVSGRSVITWDKSSAVGALNPQGLGGINFLQDSATAIVIKNIYADHSGNLKLSFFDAGDPTGLSSWSYTYAIPVGNVNTFFDLTIPFVDFIADNPGVVVDFTAIGAITLLVDGTSQPDLDLSFDSIGTNGICSDLLDIPNSNGKVIDQCGQCISDNPALDNRSCVDCLGVPNGNALPGTSCSTGEQGPCAPGTWQLIGQGPPISCQCQRIFVPSNELCDGIDNNCNGQTDEAFPLKGSTCGIGQNGCTAEGTYVCDEGGGLFCNAVLLQSQVDACENSRGCDGIPESGLVLDQCNLCGGNGTSCLDCNGTLNGTLQLDRCNVCGGNGNSCLGCSDLDITEIQTTLDNTAKQQEAELKVAYGRIDRLSNRNKKILSITKTLRAEAHRLQIENWTLSWTFPSIVTKCTNTQFCITTNNQSIADQYRANADTLNAMMTDAVKLLNKVGKGKISKKLGAKYISKMTVLYNQAIDLLGQVPVTHTTCS